MQRLSKILLAASLLVTLPLAAADRPPANLHLAGDHWTAWDPPDSFPEGANVHTIRQGDTLWDLASQFYSDPYLWPQLWELNRYIQDAHWIYPGDPLVVGAGPTPIEELAQATLEDSGAGAADGSASGARYELGSFGGAPVPLGSDTDIYCTGFIGPRDRPFAFTIVGSEYENLAPNLSAATGAGITGLYGRVDTVKLDLDLGDILYLDGGEGGGMFPGDLFTVVEARQRVKHPVTGKPVGAFYRYQGRVRVLSVQEETAIAEIVHSCLPIHVGDRLQAYVEEPIPLGRRQPIRGVNDPESYRDLFDGPAIVLSAEGLVTLGQGHLVFIDRGSSAQVTPGDVFTIYRLNSPQVPPVVIGQLAVLSVQAETAVARILESRHSIYLGDRLSRR